MGIKFQTFDMRQSSPAIGMFFNYLIPESGPPFPTGKSNTRNAFSQLALRLALETLRSPRTPHVYRLGE